MVDIVSATSIESNNGTVAIGPLDVITAVGEHCIRLGPICYHYSLKCVMLYINNCIIISIR